MWLGKEVGAAAALLRNRFTFWTVSLNLVTPINALELCRKAMMKLAWVDE